MTSLDIVCPSCFTVNRVPEERLGDHPKCGNCHEQVFCGRPVSVDSQQFRKMIERNDIPVVVDFWATWCGPCKMFGPVFAEAAGELEPRMRLIKVETDQCQDIAAALRIQSIPTLAVFQGGREIGRQAGAMPKGRFMEWLSTVSGATAAHTSTDKAATD